MTYTLLIFIGAGLGGVLRYWVSNSVHMLFDKAFPYGTIFVNVSGCFVMGLLFALLFERVGNFNAELRAFFLIGLLGGYTTFSSFAIETVVLLENGNILGGLINVLFSTLCCVLAAWVGVLAGRNLAL